jgi:hypothetical protein
VKQPKVRVPRKARSNVVQLRPDSGTRQRETRRADEDAKVYALRERHRVALEFVRELVTLLAGAPPIPDEDWIDPNPPEPEFGSRHRAWVDPDGWHRWQALKAAEVAHKHWVASGRNDDTTRRIRAVREALELARRWKGPPVDPAFIRSEAARDAPELVAVPIADWTSAIAAWPGIEAPRPVGGPRTKAPKVPKPGEAWTWELVAHRASILGPDWAEVVFALLAPHKLTDAKNPTNLAKTWAPSQAADDVNRIR